MTGPNGSSRHLRLAVLISGGGRTLKNFLELAAAGELPVEVCLVISSSPTAGGIAHAQAAQVACEILCREDFQSPASYGEAIFAACREALVDYVAMAGFLKLVAIPDDFAGRVLNIHPSLIPAFCGKGMYGDRVHQAVLDAGVKLTGVTVHYVDNQYDHGPIIWQQSLPVLAEDTVDSLGARVFELEKEAYPRVLQLLADGRVTLDGNRVQLK